MNRKGSIVYVIDDDFYVRESIEDLLRSVGHEVRSYGSVEAFLDDHRIDLPTCLVLDVRLPDTSGLEFQRLQESIGMRFPIVFITGHGDIPMSVAAMKAGAIEFLTKPFRDQDLLDAVHAGIALDRRRRADEEALTELRARYTSLTPREQETMALVVTGMLNKQIAAEIGLKIGRASCRGRV